MTQAELIDRIVSDPDADEPRQVFADWLDVQGLSDRARLVRAQLASARLPAWDPRQVDFRVTQDLLADTRRIWELDWPGPSEGARVHGWRRGLPARAEVDSFAALAGLQDRLGKLGVEELRVPMPSTDEEARSVGRIRSVRRLWITSRPGQTGRALRWLLESPVVEGLDGLGFTLGGPLERSALKVLTSWSGWPRLERFALFRARMDDADLQWLLDALPPSVWHLGFGVSLPRDPSLSLVYDDQPEPLEALAAWPGLAAIRRLDVFVTRPGERGIAELLASPHAVALRDLGLNIVARALTFPSSPSAPLQLDTLRILHGELGRGLGDDLAKARCLSGLKLLRLQGIRVAPSEVFRAMFRGPFRRSLQVIDDAGIEDEEGALGGVLDGIADGGLERLHSLCLGHSVVSARNRHKRTLDRQLETLFGTSVSETLRELVLRDYEPGENHVSGLTLLHVLRAPQLRRVRLPTALNDAEAAVLESHPRVRQLMARGGLSRGILRPTRQRLTLRR